MPKFVNIDHDTELLLPPKLREWVPEGHLVHFVMEAVDLLDVSEASVNQRGTGSAQYPPRLLLGLLVYSYATGLFSSRQIERATYENVAVRLLCADTHPDHDTLCAFRRKNGALLRRAFAQVLELAAGCGILKVGGVTVAIDGTKVLANASKHAAVSHGHAHSALREIDAEIAQLLAKAEQADSTPLQDGLTIEGEIARRHERKARLLKAKAEMEARAHARFQAEQADHEAQLARREAARQAGKKPRGREPKAPDPAPGEKDQVNFTDSESRIMKTKDGFQQCYNAQAGVETDSRLIVGARLAQAPNDKEQLVPTLPLKTSSVCFRVPNLCMSAQSRRGEEAPSFATNSARFRMRGDGESAGTTPAFFITPSICLSSSSRSVMTRMRPSGSCSSSQSGKGLRITPLSPVKSKVGTPGKRRACIAPSASSPPDMTQNPNRLIAL